MAWITAILEIIKTFLGLAKSKADKDAEKQKVLNSKEFKDAAIRQREITAKDEEERLVDLVGGADKKKSDLALDEIRRRLGS